MKPAQYRAVIFDLGGVLVSEWNEHGEWPAYIARTLSVDIEIVKRVLTEHHGDLEALEIGAIETPEFFARVWPELPTGMPLTDELAQDLMTRPLRQVEVNENMLGLVRGLRYNYKTALLTNVIPEHIDYYLHVWPQIFEVFDIADLSYDVGMRKPEEGFFEHVLVKLGAHAGEAICIDDYDLNVEAARAYGLTGVLFTNYNALRSDLRKLGLPVP